MRPKHILREFLQGAWRVNALTRLPDSPELRERIHGIQQYLSCLWRKLEPSDIACVSQLINDLCRLYPGRSNAAAFVTLLAPMV